jgi:hypothetical protein
MPNPSIAIAVVSYAGSINIGALPSDSRSCIRYARSPQSHERQRPKTCERFGSATRLKAGSQPIGGRDSVITTGHGTVKVCLGASCKRSPLWLRSTETTSAWVPREAPMPLTALASPVTARQPTTPVMAIFLTARRRTRSEITPVLFVSNSDSHLTGKLRWSARPALSHYG